ncbi:MAG: hypothetical protein Q9222_000485 [Ikaeria aurantiellina]
MDELRPFKDPADAQLYDAINKDEWRRALQLIEKREKKLKKGLLSDWLMACKASVLLMLPEPVKKSQGRSALETLFERNPPIVDFNALVTLQMFAEKRNDLDPRISTFWMKAATAQPGDEDLHTYWFNKCFWLDDWQGARKAAMTYAKNFSSKREPFFWNIFATYKASKDEKVSSQERTLCGKLAHKWCAKAAEDTPLSKDQELKNGRVLRTSRDVLFLLDVYESDNRHEESLEILDSDRTGIQSRIGKRSWSLVLRKIKLLEYLQRWPALFRYCFEILIEADPTTELPKKHGFGEFGNNWSIWASMVEAATKHRTTKFDIADWYPSLSETVACGTQKSLFEIALLVCCIYIRRTDDQHLRNPICAMMLVRKNLVLLENDEYRRLEHQAALAENFYTYFALYGGKTFCFNDLKPYLDALPVAQIQHFFQKATKLISTIESNSGQDSGKAPSATTVMLRVNLLKIDYFTNLSRLQDLKCPAEDASFRRFVLDCIQVYNLGIESRESGNGGQSGERFPGDDGGLMAAIGLLKMYLEGSYRKGVLQAITILQHLIYHSPSNYEAFVLLTLLYIRLGAGCIAVEHYHQLSIKNIQLPNTSWILCTRLSTIHPHSPHTKPSNSAVQVNVDPVVHLSQSLEYHLHLEERDRQEMYEFLQLEEYASLIKAMENTAFNTKGYAKHMLLVERLRIERLSGISPDPKYQSLPDESTPNAAIIDNRDTIPVPRWESPGSKQLLDLIMPGKWPKAGWLSQQLFIAKTFKSATNKDILPYKTNEDGFYVPDTDQEDDTTAQESTQYKLAQECHSMLLVYRDKMSEGAIRRQNSIAVLHSLETIERRQREANESMSAAPMGSGKVLWDVTETIAAPDWRFFHMVYIGLDSCTLIKSTMDVIEDGNRNFQLITPQQVAEQTSTIRKLCEEYRAQVHATARGLQKDLSDGKHNSELLATIIGQTQVSEDEDPITYWIRRIAVPESAVELTVARLCQAWTEALENICRLTSS